MSLLISRSRSQAGRALSRALSAGPRDPGKPRATCPKPPGAAVRSLESPVKARRAGEWRPKNGMSLAALHLACWWHGAGTPITGTLAAFFRGGMCGAPFPRSFNAQERAHADRTKARAGGGRHGGMSGAGRARARAAAATRPEYDLGHGAGRR